MFGRRHMPLKILKSRRQDHGEVTVIELLWVTLLMGGGVAGLVFGYHRLGLFGAMFGFVLGMVAGLLVSCVLGFFINKFLRNG